MNKPAGRHPENLPAPVAGLVPHRRPVRLVEELVSVHATGGRATAVIQKDNPFLTPDGALERSAYVELIAQAFAAIQGWHDRQQSRPPRAGYLVGADGVEFAGTARVGDRIDITIQKTDTFGAFILVDGRVTAGNQLLAAGRLKLWLAPEGGKPTANPSQTARATPPPGLTLKARIQSAAVQPPDQVSTEHIHQSFCFPPDFVAFQGHFPGDPLLPAFLQVAMGQAVLECAQQTPVMLERLDKAKFREPLRPGQTIRVDCRMTGTDARQATVALTVTGRPAASFHLTLSAMSRTPG
jgi:3-hydroxyacyl-[acyl-carrier-protein] dehydratase